jgi:hypothetical protein
MQRARVAACLVLSVALAIGAGPMLGFLLPHTVDATVESVEPLQTFRFFYSQGTAYDPWGPLPHILYALPFGAWLAGWKLGGQWQGPNTEYPYGFARPHEQLGALILTGRVVGLLVFALAALCLLRSLARATGSYFWSCSALLLCLAGSPEVLVALSSTKPDTLMLAFAMLALAAYVDQLQAGATRKGLALLAASCAASVSCKELTAPLAICLGLAAWVLRHPQDRVRPVRRLGHLVLWGGLTYALLNVVYAPRAWWQRMQVVLFGKLKDSEVWAASSQSLGSYLLDSLQAGAAVLGLAGCSALAWAACSGGPAPRLRKLAIAWPLIGYTLLVVAIAGYMPSYFLLPLAPLAASFVALVLGQAGARAQGRRAHAAISALVALQLGTAWWYGHAHRAWHPESLAEQHLAHREPAPASVARLSLWGSVPGSSRLAYLGFATDERALGRMLAESAQMPELLLVDQEHWAWVADIAHRPARAAMLLEETGLDYSAGVRLEDHGYRMVERQLGPHIAPWLTWLQPRALRIDHNPLLVYARLDGDGRPAPAASLDGAGAPRGGLDR